MRAVQLALDFIQRNCEPRAVGTLDLGTQVPQQRLDFTPVKIAAGRFGEDGFQNALVLVTHRCTVGSRITTGFGVSLPNYSWKTGARLGSGSRLVAFRLAEERSDGVIGEAAQDRFAQGFRYSIHRFDPFVLFHGFPGRVSLSGQYRPLIQFSPATAIYRSALQPVAPCYRPLLQLSAEDLPWLDPGRLGPRVAALVIFIARMPDRPRRTSSAARTGPAAFAAWPWLFRKKTP